MSLPHAVLEARGVAWVLSDSKSRNGTFVAGEKIDTRPLSDGDMIEIGHSLFCFRVVLEDMAVQLLQGERVRVGPTETRSPEMVTLVKQLDRIAKSREPVLLLGETGAGKEIVARMLHERSGRGARNGQLVTVNGGAVPRDLFESILFGHRKGSFTGALEHRTGEIVVSDGGTLFLDEVANLDPASQAKLLRVIEDGLVTPIGGLKPQKVDVRWVTATNAELFATESSFRKDLVERLAGFVGRIPPLRARREDLGLLARHILSELHGESESVSSASRGSAPTNASPRAPVVISPAAARKLFLGPLSGNVRELRSRLRAAVMLAEGQRIEEEHIQDRGAGATPPVVIDAAYVKALLDEAGGNVALAARRIGKDPKQVHRWIKKYGLRSSESPGNKGHSGT